MQIISSIKNRIFGILWWGDIIKSCIKLDVVFIVGDRSLWKNSWELKGMRPIL